MSLGFTGVGFGGSPVRFSRNPVDLGTGMQRRAIRYPNPFFDSAQTYFPTHLKQMLRWCRYFFFTNPLINAVVYKLAEYPITEIAYKTKDEKVRRRYQNLFENTLQIRKFQIEVGLDYYNYGNAFVTVQFPFVKYLGCMKCGNEAPIKELRRHYKFQDLKYYLTCPKCGERAPAKVRDETIKSPNGIRLIRWDPERVEIEDNSGLTDPTYYYQVPQSLKNSIVLGKRSVVEHISDKFVEALRKKKAITFAKGSLFHLKRPIIAQKDQGWGMPLVLPVLKDIFYLQILRKAQEAIAQEHVVPLRVLFPAAGSSTSDPWTSINLPHWRDQIEEEIVRWRADPNYIPVLPTPIGHELIGGQGRALILHQELRVWSEQIIAGMNVPLEFIFGGVSYTGSNVSMRILENQFMGYREDQKRMVGKFIMGRICDQLGWPEVPIEFVRFRMADDLQRLMLYFQANQAMKISDTTFLRELGEDIVEEEVTKQSELVRQISANKAMMVAQASAEGEAQLASLRYQLQASKMQQQAMMPTGEDPTQTAMLATAPQSLRGDQIAPGVPNSVAVIPGMMNAGVPGAVASPFADGQQAGTSVGTPVVDIAQRIASKLKSLQREDPQAYHRAVNEMRMRNPQLFKTVEQYLVDTGGQRDPLNAMQRPMPEVKPPRAVAGRSLI